MRTLEPDTVLERFLERTTDSFDRYTNLYEAVKYDRTTLRLRQGLTADVAFRLASDWEIFQHEWYIAAISKKPTKFRQRVQTDMEAKLEKMSLRPQLEALEVLQPGSPIWTGALSGEQIAALADPSGYNVTFASNRAWLKESAINLDSVFVDKVRSIASKPEHACVLDVLRALRNVIAHGSSGSVRRLNACIAPRPKGKLNSAGGGNDEEPVGLVGAANSFLLRPGGRKIQSVPRYLHGDVEASGKTRRVTLLIGRIEEIAEMLRT